MPTDKLFTGQTLDSTGLYYYGARYYDPSIGKFISPDSEVPNPADPQNLNRYSYALNNPLKYNDPSGHTVNITEGGLQSWIEFCQNNPDTALALGRLSIIVNWGPNGIISSSQPVSTEQPEPAKPGFNNSPLAMASGVAIIAAPADTIGVGELVTGAVIIVGGIAWVVINREAIVNTASNSWSSLTTFFSKGKALGKPTEKDGYKEPKNYNGKKVKNPNGSGAGYPDKNGNVWIPTNHGGNEAWHWDVETLGGGYYRVFPK